MSNRVFAVKPGFRLGKERTQRYGEYIWTLCERGDRLSGGVTPRVILDDAKKHESPLHDYFDWDNTLAAEKWRLQQAGQLLRNIELVETKDSEEWRRRAFRPIELEILIEEAAEEPKSRMMTIHAIEADPVLRAQVCEKAKRDLQVWLDNYFWLEELSGCRELVLSAMETIVNDIPVVA